MNGRCGTWPPAERQKAVRCYWDQRVAGKFTIINYVYKCIAYKMKIYFFTLFIAFLDLEGFIA